MDLVEGSFLSPGDCSDDHGLTLSDLEYNANENRAFYDYLDVSDGNLDLLILDLDVDDDGLRLSDLDVDDDGHDSPCGGGASEEVIDRLKRERVVEGKSIKRNLESVDCVVCLEELSGAKRLIRMPCSHLFHESCILNWLQTKSSCPMCRQIPYDHGRT